jgi:hypothetical protein
MARRGEEEHLGDEYPASLGPRSMQFERLQCALRCFDEVPFDPPEGLCSILAC